MVAVHVCDLLNLTAFVPSVSIGEMIIVWNENLPKNSHLHILPFHMMWIFWKARNRAIFEGEKRNIYSLIQQIINTVKALPSPIVSRKVRRRNLGRAPCMVFPCGYMDGASRCMIAGVGFCIFLNETHYLEFSLGVGYGTNTKAELLSLWALLHSSQMMGIPLSHAFGDSLVIINWARGSTALSPPDLLHWCRETKKLMVSFQDMSFSHIYREHNRSADRLSKIALSYPQGKGFFKEFFENHLVTQDTFQLF